MKKIICLLLGIASFTSNAQIYIPDVRQTGFAIEMGGSALFSMVPSRLNTFEISSGYTEKETFETYNSMVLGIKGDFSISPIYHENFAYFFTTNGMFGWLGPNGQSSFYMGHQFRIGLPRLKFIYEFGNYKFRRTTYYSFETISRTSGTEKLGRSLYDDIDKIRLGGHFTFNGEQTLCIMYTREKYNPIISLENAKGIFVEFATANKVSFFTDIVFGHPIKGNYFLSTPLTNNDLAKTAFSFQVGVRKSFLFEKNYLELIYADF